MILPTGPVRVLMATRPVGFRKGMDGLAALVREQLKADPFSGVVYVFRAKRADRVKLVFWDGTGVVLIAKRLEQGTFRWPACHRESVLRVTGTHRTHDTRPAQNPPCASSPQRSSAPGSIT